MSEAMSDPCMRRAVLAWLCAGTTLALLQGPLSEEYWVLAPLAGMGYLALGVVLAGYIAWSSHPRAARSTILLAAGVVLGLALGAVLGFLALGACVAGYAGWSALGASRAS